MLADLEALLDPPAGAEALSRPVRVVVPSRSLRLHLASRLMERRGRPAVGLTVQTLYALAMEVLHRASEPLAPQQALFEVLVRRAVAEEEVLRRELSALQDGFGTAGGTIRDLLDAAYEPAHEEALLEALEERLQGPRGAERPSSKVERAQALVRVASAVHRRMAELGVVRASTLYLRTEELLRQDPERLLPARALLVHGFADATGVAGDLLRALLARPGAAFYLDHPPDPRERARTDRGALFTRALVEKLGYPFPERAPAEPPAPRLRLVEAGGGEAEVRWAALAVRELLAAGTPPERVGLVVRTLEPYRLILRRHLRALGVPFSDLGRHGPDGAAARRAAGLAGLLQKADAAPPDRWLDLVVRLPDGAGDEPLGPARREELRLGLRALGIARLADLAALDVAAALGGLDGLPLPVRKGVSRREREAREEAPAADEEPDAEARPELVRERRRLSGALLRTAVAAGGRTCRLLAELAREPALERWVERLGNHLREELGWDPASPAEGEVLGALAGLAEEIPVRFELAPEEIGLLLRRRLEEVGRQPLGGAGSGVQVLDVVEARGRTFEALFLLGMNRDLFPRTVREDPLLPDSLRASLQSALPDLPVKSRGYDEERYLFAQLLAAAPQVTLTWQASDDDGKLRSPSPFVERLRLADPDLETLAAPAVLLPEAPPAAPLPAAERSLLAGLAGSRQGVAQALEVAIEEGRREPTEGRLDLDAAAVARGRLAVIEEIDPAGATPEVVGRTAGLGPYFGFIGRLNDAPDPRQADLYVTTLEGLARCPWQAFLGRLMRLEPLPDPVEALPALDRRQIGVLVHRVLERLFESEGSPAPASLAEALEAPGRTIDWPPPEALDRLLEEQAERLLREEGQPLPGLARALARLAAPYVEAARQVDLAEAPVEVLAAEVEGRFEAPPAGGGRLPLRIRIDRVDRRQGTLRLTDFKTGKPIAKATTPQARRRHHLARVMQGTRLQAVAALAALPEAERGEALARYLALEPGIEKLPLRVDEAEGGDAEFGTAFARTLEVLLEQWRDGHLFPRLVEPDRDQEPSACGYCEVAIACLRLDSAQRQRLVAWSESRLASERPPAGEAALVRAWRLPALKPGGDGKR